MEQEEKLKMKQKLEDLQRMFQKKENVPEENKA